MRDRKLPYEEKWHVQEQSQLLFGDELTGAKRSKRLCDPLFAAGFREELINPLTYHTEAPLERAELIRLMLAKKLVAAFQGYQDIDSPSLAQPQWHSYRGGEFLPRFLGRQVVAPAQFLQTSEAGTQLLGEISLGTLELACALTAHAQLAGAPEMIVSVNAPKEMLSQDNCGERISVAISQNGISLRMLVLEIMEQKPLSEKDDFELLRTITANADCVELAIDDYPEKYALANMDILLKNDVPIGTVKIAGKHLRHVTPQNYRALLLRPLRDALKVKPHTLVFEGDGRGLHPAIIDLIKTARDQLDRHDLSWLFEGRLVVLSS